MGQLLEAQSLKANPFTLPESISHQTAKVRLYVVHDKWGWNAGVVPTDLEDVTGAIEEVTTNSSGEFVRTLVWASAQPVNGQRDFDLVANVADEKGNFDTRYMPGVDAVDADLMAGFTVQGPAQPIVRVDLASDMQGNYRDSFSADETVTIWVNPPNRPLIPFMMVRKYICPLKVRCPRKATSLELSSLPNSLTKATSLLTGKTLSANR
jgi:hypothetical protein